MSKRADHKFHHQWSLKLLFNTTQKILVFTESVTILHIIQRSHIGIIELDSKLYQYKLAVSTLWRRNTLISQTNHPSTSILYNAGIYNYQHAYIVRKYIFQLYKAVSIFWSFDIFSSKTIQLNLWSMIFFMFVYSKLDFFSNGEC